MSFQHKNCLIPRDAECLAKENVGYENSSRIEAKHGRQWFMNTGEPQVFGSNKKQALEDVSGNPISGVSHVNISPLDTNSGFHSITSQSSDRVFGSGLGAFNLVDKNMPSIGDGNLNTGRRGFENQYGNDPSVGLSISHTIEDPSSCLSFGGIRKVKVSRVTDSDKGMSSSMGCSYCRGDNNTISIGAGCIKDDGSISLGLTYSNANDNVIPTVTTITKAGGNIVSVGDAFNKGGGSFMLMGHDYGKGDGNVFSISQAFDRRDRNFVSIGQSYDKEDDNMSSLGTMYSKGHENSISMGPTIRRSRENFTTTAASYDNGIGHIISIGPTYGKVDSNIASTVPSYDKEDSRSLAMGNNHTKGDGSTSFGVFHDDPEPNQSGGIFSGYHMLMMGNQTSSRGLDGKKARAESNSELAKNNIPKSNPESRAPKTTKKDTTNNFPLNVKSMLSTGIFDGVPVNYVSISRERTLTGIIKGAGYLCSCHDCKQSKRHAGAKSKHPNTHIYFENGKTIYAVVQELKSTPQEILFDVIENVTGSTINEKNFRNWKASYQAATRELQRIYGKDEVITRF
ncbi:putative Jas TPL-binding domain-containing protein [Lupinus albus]|uniref:Putative Jas TPL-binding domain-containing protein n=1 Tax=Lupinus albus TaxID=3870 RepID=A0A6A4QZC4_LUPAL|nr:putative Jas TPL-binding domain-containing protein [Lupinus albus]